ncbi:MAG TPA: acyltransferase [Acidimicrobiales bacterium]|nr:acyltransferase [Acidimicrobiales bacterium]
MPSVVEQAGELRSARVESLRALAALGVLEGHVYGGNLNYGPAAYSSWWHRSLLGGGFGVYLFFCLSGYLLYLPFARRSFGGAGPVDLRRYARNRAVRILPLYYVVAVTYLIVLHAPAGVWVRFLTFTENFSHRTVSRYDGPMWSLVVEIMFYLLLPLIALVISGLSRGSLVRAGALLVLAAGVFGAYRWVAFLHSAHPSPLVQYNLPATFYFFIPGMMLALVRVGAEARGTDWSGQLLGRSWVWVAASAACWALIFYRYQWDLLAGAASLLLLGACVLPLARSRLVGALGWRPLAALGIASYSLYLWHMPIVDYLARRHLGGYLGHLAVSGTICIAIAAVSYWVVEAPFLRLRRRWGATAASDAVGPTQSRPASAA